jgi:hypothetical protein
MLDRPGLLREESYRETTEAWLAAFDAAVRARSAAELSQLFVADSHWRNLFGLSLAFCDLQRQHDGHGRTAGAVGAEAGARHFRIDTARLAPRGAVVAGREVVRRSLPSRPLAARAMAPSGCCAKVMARRAPGRFRPRSISTPSAPRATRPQRHPTSGILPAGLARAAAGLRQRCLCGLVGVHALAQLLREPDLALALAVNAYANHSSSSATAMATRRDEDQRLRIRKPPHRAPPLCTSWYII